MEFFSRGADTALGIRAVDDDRTADGKAEDLPRARGCARLLLRLRPDRRAVLIEPVGVLLDDQPELAERLAIARCRP